MSEPTTTHSQTPSSNGQRQPAPAAEAPIAEQTSPSTPAQQFLCPYCGHISANPTRCDHCKGLFEPLSRQATQNHMGPWQLRDHKNPFQPGCSFATLRQLIARGKVTRNTIIRGPTTRQFWSFACNAPGVAVLLGECHSCHAKVKPDEYMCARCNAILSPPTDRQHLGLSPVKLLPGQASPAAVASSSMATPSSHHKDAGRSGAHPAARARHARVRGSSKPGGSPPSARQSAGAARVAPETGRETIRRLRERVRFMTGALIFAGILIVAMMVLYAATVLAGSSSLHFGRPAAPKPSSASQSGEHSSAAAPITGDSPTPTAAESAAPSAADAQPGEPTTADTTPPGSADGAPAHGAQSATSTAGLDPGLAPWGADIRQAADLEKRDTVEDLESAVTILRRVLKEATTTATDAGEAAPTFPLLEARIDRLTERIDRLKLRDVLN